MNASNNKLGLLYQQLIEISNDLSKLIPVGTLNFYNLPYDYSDLGGIPTVANDGNGSKTGGTDEWKWLDIDFFVQICKGAVHPVIKDLQFLVSLRFAMATFKIVKIRTNQTSSDYVNICVVRIYSISSDIPGARYFSEWRSSKPKYLNIDKSLSKIWYRFIEILDYSSEGWNECKDVILTDISNCGMLLINARNRGSGYIIDSTDQEKLNFHMDRWTKNMPYNEYSNPLVIGDEETFGIKVSKIYNNIISPDLSKYENKTFKESSTLPNPEEVISRLLSDSQNGSTSIQGVSSQLYHFQIMSLCKMLEKESFDRKALVPNFIKLKSPDIGTYYHFDLLSNSFYQKPELYTLPNGGILAENMGLGKTLICLSLICLTKCEMSRIPDTYLLYNENEYEDVVILNNHNGPDELSWKSQPRAMALVDLCKDCINHNSLPWKHYIDDLPSSVVKKLSDSPGYFRISLENHNPISKFSLRTTKSATRRKLTTNCSPEGRIYRTLYLCNSTLIIVPDNLFHQWNNEMKKHIKPMFLNKLFISGQFQKPIHSDNSTFTNELPQDPKILIKFDLIMISHTLLAKQFTDNSVESVLDKVYWKRLIIDEGHSVQSKNSRASLICKGLHAERRWAVTGTPTSGLTRLHMEEEHTQEDSDNNSKVKRNQYVVKSKFNEKDDLIKLGTIVSNFLKIEPFHSQQKLWSTTIIKPLSSGIYGSAINLSNLLNDIVVRHSSKDIESDIKLPQLHHEPVFLQPSYHNKLAINLFTAVLAVNAVSSERSDVDYMFHPSNRQQLRRLITNLQRATFHWTGFKQEDIETLIHICNLSLKKRKANGKSVYNDEDLSILKKSIEISKTALSNSRWRTISLLHEMNYYVSGLPDIFTKNFGTGVLEIVNKDGKRDDVSVFGAPHLNSIQEFFYKNRFIDMNDEESLKSKLEMTSKPFWSTYWKYNMKRNAERFNKQDDNQNFSSNVKPQQIENAINVPNIVEGFSPQHEFPKATISTPRKNSSHLVSDLSPKDKLTRDYGDGLKSTDEIKTNQCLDEHDLSYQMIKKTRIIGTASSKLSYLASRLLEHQLGKVKSLVFFEFEDSAYYLTELLDILGIRYILYATFINPSQRTSNLADFSNYPSATSGGITLIMDLRLASHGLNIIAATRVYFINPVWQRSIEAQAIKRAHRIGQTQEVFVETLVLKGTLEEEIYKRRSLDNDIKGPNAEDADTKQKRYVIDDTGMQEFIMRHEFLEYDSKEPEFASFVAPAVNPCPSLPDEEDHLDSEFSLLKHKDIVHRSDSSPNGVKDWQVYVFNEDNLTHLNDLKNQKINKEFVQGEFLRKFIDPYEKDIDSGKDADIHGPKQYKDGPSRKKVRF